jgi:molybdenum cofactor guanylyltransferase
MLGIVLCGGASSRMGSDKGLLPTNNGNWSGVMVDKLKSLNIPVAISVNQQQIVQYAASFENIEMIVDDDSILLKGPLAAVLSAHIKHPEEDLFVLACDMPLMEPIVLQALYNNYLKNSDNHGFVFTNYGEPEPLCGIYTSWGLAQIRKLYESGQLVKHSMKFMLDHLSVFQISIPENWKIYFRNFNAHADLNGL